MENSSEDSLTLSTTKSLSANITTTLLTCVTAQHAHISLRGHNIGDIITQHVHGHRHHKDFRKKT